MVLVTRNSPPYMVHPVTEPDGPETNDIPIVCLYWHGERAASRLLYHLPSWHAAITKPGERLLPVAQAF